MDAGGAAWVGMRTDACMVLHPWGCMHEAACARAVRSHRGAYTGGGGLHVCGRTHGCVQRAAAGAAHTEMHPWGRTAGDAHAGMHSCTLSFRGHRSSQTDPPPSHPQPRSAGAPPAPPQAHSHQQPGPQPPPPVLTQFLKRENDRSSCPAPPAHHRLQLRAQHRGSNTATPPLPHPPPPPHPDAVHPPKQRTDAFPTAPVGSPRIPAVPFRAGPRRWGGGGGRE